MSQSLSDLCTPFVQTGKLKDEVERNIIEFCESPWGLGMGASSENPPLAPVQKFLFKCYYNIPLDNKEKNIIINDMFNEKERFRLTEIEYLKFLYEEGRINVKEITGKEDDMRPNLILVFGRRGYKTSSIAVLCAFELYKLIKKYCPQEYYGIMPDDEIRISCIATNQEQASELFRRITGHIESADFFKKYRNKPTLNYMQISTQRDVEKYGPGMRPSLRIVASPCSGRGLRGHNNIIAILDEFGFFFESETSKDRSDENIYNAVTPSTAQFTAPNKQPHGRIINISSPGNRSGKFYKLFTRSMEPDCKDLLMIQAPTWEVDPTLSPKFLRAKYSENPVTFMSEYGAEFSDRISGWIDNEQLLRMNIIPGLKEKKQSYERVPHFMGIDIGLKNDGTAIAIVHIVKKEIGGVMKDCIELDYTAVRYAKDEDKEFFPPEEMAEWVSTFTNKFFLVKAIMDQYYGMAMLPFLHRKGLKYFDVQHMSRDFNSRVYQNLMSKMLDSSLRIPEGDLKEVDGKTTKDSDLVRELLRLKATHHSKYIISVEAPDVKDAHDDLSDAYARAVYLATEYLAKGGSAGGKDRRFTGRSSRTSYHKYHLRQKKASVHTRRPSSTVQRDLARNVQLGSHYKLSNLGRRGF